MSKTIHHKTRTLFSTNSEKKSPVGFGISPAMGSTLNFVLFKKGLGFGDRRGRSSGFSKCFWICETGVEEIPAMTASKKREQHFSGTLQGYLCNDCELRKPDPGRSGPVVARALRLQPATIYAVARGGGQGDGAVGKTTRSSVNRKNSVVVSGCGDAAGLFGRSGSPKARDNLFFRITLQRPQVTTRFEVWIAANLRGR